MEELIEGGVELVTLGVVVSLLVELLEHTDVVLDVVRLTCSDSAEEALTGFQIRSQVVGRNTHSIGICYEGGLDSAGDDADTRTPEQVKALRELVERMHSYFPKALIVGHCDLDPSKKCPCYDAVAEYRDLQPKI